MGGMGIGAYGHPLSPDSPPFTPSPYEDEFLDTLNEVLSRWEETEKVVGMSMQKRLDPSSKEEQVPLLTPPPSSPLQPPPLPMEQEEEQLLLPRVPPSSPSSPPLLLPSYHMELRRRRPNPHHIPMVQLLKQAQEIFKKGGGKEQILAMLSPSYEEGFNFVVSFTERTMEKFESNLDETAEVMKAKRLWYACETESSLDQMIINRLELEANSERDGLWLLEDEKDIEEENIRIVQQRVESYMDDDSEEDSDDDCISYDEDCISVY